MTIAARRLSGVRYVSGAPSRPPPSVGDNSRNDRATYDVTDKGEIPGFPFATLETDRKPRRFVRFAFFFPILTNTEYALFMIVKHLEEKGQEVLIKSNDSYIFYIFDGNTSDRYCVQFFFNLERRTVLNGARSNERKV